MIAAISRRSSWLCVPLLLVIVTLAWCAHYGRWNKSSWSVPVAFLGDPSWDMASSSDAIWGMAATKARVDGEISFFNKQPISFGAPFRANWNDWPTVEEAVDCWWAMLARAFGLFAGSNLALLSAHLFAALSFYYVSRYLRYDATFAAAGAILFALSRYAFWRGLPHLTLTFYWHLPLVLLVLWWCVREEPIAGDRKKLWLCFAIVVITGLQNAYYSAIFLQLLLWAALYGFLRWRITRRTLFPIALVFLLLATIAFANIDTFHSWLTHGSSIGVGPRTYSESELYALRPVELLLPRSHSLAALQSWTNHVYFGWSLYPGEEGSVYLGLAGILSLAFLLGLTFKSVVEGELWKVPMHFWGIFLIACFSVVGGLNGFIGLAGIRLFRCGNRYSIVILTILLFFLVKQLNWLARRWHPAARIACASFLIALGLYDQLPPRHPDQLSKTRSTLAEDAEFVSQIEGRLPKSAKLFQLPVRDFPEAPPLNSMVDYEHFRPYLHSRDLRFSYGDPKVSQRSRWQKEAEHFEPRGLITLLETYGFDAIVLNRRGYIDRAVLLIAELRAAGADLVNTESEDLVCFRLNPARRALLPPTFGEGWYDLEGDYKQNSRWSSGNAVLVLTNGKSQESHVHLSFGIASATPRNVKIMNGSQTLYQATLDPATPPSRLDLHITLKPGTSELRFITDAPGKATHDEDQKVLAYKIIDFQISPDGAEIAQPAEAPTGSLP